jgi:uncharacterized membrane protein YphA (DoxX/SURF4 family)
MFWQGFTDVFSHYGLTAAGIVGTCMVVASIVATVIVVIGKLMRS